MGRPAGLFDSLSGQPAFGIEGRHATGAGCCDGLSEVVVGHIACGKDALDAGVGSLGGCPGDISLVVRLQLSVKKVRVGGMSDGGEVSCGIQDFRL